MSRRREGEGTGGGGLQSYQTFCFDIVHENYCLRPMKGDFQDLVSTHHGTTWTKPISPQLLLLQKSCILCVRRETKELCVAFGKNKS